MFQSHNNNPLTALDILKSRLSPNQNSQNIIQALTSNVQKPQQQQASIMNTNFNFQQYNNNTQNLQRDSEFKNQLLEAITKKIKLNSSAQNQAPQLKDLLLLQQQYANSQAQKQQPFQSLLDQIKRNNMNTQANQLLIQSLMNKEPNIEQYQQQQSKQQEVPSLIQRKSFSPKSDSEQSTPKLQKTTILINNMEEAKTSSPVKSEEPTAATKCDDDEQIQYNYQKSQPKKKKEVTQQKKEAKKPKKSPPKAVKVQPQRAQPKRNREPEPVAVSQESIVSNYDEAELQSLCDEICYVFGVAEVDKTKVCEILKKNENDPVKVMKRILRNKYYYKFFFGFAQKKESTEAPVANAQE